MKIKDLRQKTKNELEATLKEKRETLRKFYFQTSHSKMKNVKEARETRKDIARIITLIKEPDLSAKK